LAVAVLSLLLLLSLLPQPDQAAPTAMIAKRANIALSARNLELPDCASLICLPRGGFSERMTLPLVA
jgi:hypothetical protein